jgi:hypothetical protein
MDEPRMRLNRTDILLIGLLAVLTLGLRAFQLATTEVTARDSISYIHIAWRLEHGDWLKVIPAAPQHPGYPVAVLAASLPARCLVPNDLPYAMQLAAQLASAAASVVLVVPLYWLGRDLFSARTAFGAVLLFQSLPCSGRILADGLSEGVFLLFALSALALAACALRSGSVVGFALSGLAGGLAYLTRPEGLLVPAAAGLTLLGMQLFPRWRRPWRKLVACGAALTISTLMVGGPFMVLIRGLTNKNTGGAIIHDTTGEALLPPAGGAGRGPMFAVWWQGDPAAADGRYAWALQTLGAVTAKAFFFVFWVPALAGLICFHRRLRAVPAAWMMLLVCAALAALLFRVAGRMGYLSDRHTILILACGVVWAAAALDGAGRVLAWLLARARPALRGKWWADGRAWAAGLLVVAAAAPLARTLEPLHGDRVGFRAAGYWLRQNARPEETVFDPFGWSGYYAGRYFREDAVLYFRQETFPKGPWNYVVVEEGANSHSHLVTAAAALRLAHEHPDGKVKGFPAPRGRAMATVAVYDVGGASVPAEVADTANAR